MSKPVLFSIVIPTYNREKFILNTLESVFSQTYPHYEIIIVDNCSTDSTLELLKPLADKGKIKLILHERNYERARSRNTGMENAGGDFLTLLDSDDFMYPNCLKDATEFISKNAETKCFHNLYELVDDQKNVIQKYDFPPLDDQIKAIVSGNFMSCIGNFMHREVYQKYRFDTFADLTGAEDWEFWLRVLSEYKVSRIEKVNNGILHHSSRTVNSKHFESLEKGYEYLFDKFRKDEHLSHIYGKYLNRIEANSYMYLATLALTGGFFGEARSMLKKVMKADKTVMFSNRFSRLLLRTTLKLKID
jgi:glycosyltransferase involved in cell wall biosynthesis